MNRMKIRSMSNAVLRHVESSGKDGGSGSIVSEESRRERFQAGILNTHPVLVSPKRQHKEAHSYLKIYTQHELAALVGRDVEERLERAHDAQQDEESF